MPPVAQYSYPTGADDVVVQVDVASNGPLPLPLLTIYGDRRVIAATDDGWLDGTASDLTLQDFFDDAEAVGLLDRELVLRGPDPAPVPDISVFIDVDGARLRHELDLVRIEWPIEPRAFLQRVSTRNVFGLTEPFEPERWISCGDGGGDCAVTTEPTATFARPVLPHEDGGTLVSEAATGEP